MPIWILSIRFGSFLFYCVPLCKINVRGKIYNMKFGDVLRNLLEERDLSQKQLATELKLLAPTLGRYIRNEREPDIETIKAIAKYFNVSADYLLNLKLGKSNSKKENEILRIFRSLDDEQQDLFIDQGKVLIRHNHKEKINAKSS